MKVAVLVRRSLCLVVLLCGLAGPSIVRSSLITVHLGDTLGINFRFDTPFAAPPDTLEGFVPSYHGSYHGVARATLYDGTTPLGSYTDGGSGTIFAGLFFSSDNPRTACGLFGCAPHIDFSTIRNRTIDGKITATLLSGDQFIFDPLHHFPAIVRAISSQAQTASSATILSITLNGVQIYTPPPSPTCPDIINGSISAPVLGDFTPLGDPTSITATFVPGFNLTLQQTATACGFVNFNWVQTITHAPDPLPYWQVNTINPAAPIKMTSAMVPFSDPPPGGYTYCLGPKFNGLGCDDYPFYWNVNSSGNMFSLDQWETTHSLTFRDLPMDPCLGETTFLISECSYSPFAVGDHLGFTTHLAGVRADGSAVDLGIGFKWTSTYTGFGGGIATTLNPLPGDPANGTGGITVVEVTSVTTYQDPAADREPPTTVATPSIPPNGAGWNSTDLTVILTATDNSGGSGVKQISYSMTGAQVGSAVVQGSVVWIQITAEGSTTVTYSATDNAGNAESPKTLTLNVDKTPPSITGLPVNCSLWPPDHQMVQVATIFASENVSGLASFAVTGASNEPASPGENDVVITGAGFGPRVVQVRAERLGTGSGRVYTLAAIAQDAAGNSAKVTATCVVPHDQSK